MPSFEKPSFAYNVKTQSEINAQRNYRDTKPGRKIPAKNKNSLLLATWNIANLGEQDRQTEHHKIIAELLSWFDLIAVQEVKGDLSGIRALLAELPASYKMIFSDEAGNKERMAFLYDSSKVTLLEEVGEISIPPSELSDIKLPGVTYKFTSFDRNPYIANFKAGNLEFALVNVHLYFGDMKTAAKKKSSMERRSLETLAVGRWTDLRSKSKYAYTGHTLALGDFNLPKRVKGDAIHDALTKRGLLLPEHTSLVYSNLNNDEQYDQIAFLPRLKNKIKAAGVYDFDGIIFADLYQSKTESQFKAYIRYYISDHRPMWMELDIR